MATPANRFQDELLTLGRRSADVVMDIYRSMTGAGLDRLESLGVITPIVVAAAMNAENVARGQFLADMQTKGVDTAAALPASAYVSRTDYAVKERIVRGLLTEDEAENIGMKLERFATNDPIESAQLTYTDSMRASGQVAGYVRVLEADACELCEWLYRDGYVWPPSKPLTTHKGCVCSAAPVTPDELKAAADRRYTTINRYGQRVPNPAGGGQTISADRYAQRQRELWYSRADYAARYGVSPDEWGGPVEDGNRTDDRITL